MGQPVVNSLASAFAPKPIRPLLNIQAVRERAVSVDAGSAVRHRAAAIENFEAFADIPMADRIAIVASAQDRQFPRRHSLFFEGDPARQVILLTSGFAKISQLGANGQEVILRLNGPGDVLGGMGRCANCEHCSTACTVQAATALVWETAQFEAVCERFPVLRRNIAHVLERRLNELDVRFREISTEKVSPRLSSQLVRLMSQVGKAVEEGQIEIALSRRELAQLTGTTLFTVSRLLCRWEARGIVSARREAVLVRDLPALLELSRSE